MSKSTTMSRSGMTLVREGGDANCSVLTKLMKHPFKNMSQLAEFIKQDTGLDQDKMTDVILHYVLLGDYFYRAFNDNKLMDATVDIGKNFSFDAHSMVLACHSEFFYNHILGTDTCDDDILLEDLHPDSFKQVLEFMYTGQIKVNVDNMIDLYQLAGQLKIHTLKQACLNYLETVEPDVALLLMVKAKTAKIPYIYSHTHDAVLAKFSEVMKVKAFLELDVDDLCDLLKHDDIEVKSEMNVFQTAIRWIEHDKEPRSQFGQKVLGCIRFRYVQTPELITCMDTIRNLLGEAVCENLIMGASWYHTCASLGKTEEITLDNDDKPRTCLSINPMFPSINRTASAMGDHQDSIQIQQIFKKDDSDAEFNYAEELPVKRNKHAAVYTDNCVYVIGGTDGNLAQDSLYVYYVNDRTWQEKAPMAKCRQNAMACHKDGFIYVLGGQDESGRVLSSMERYDLEREEWCELANATVARVGGAISAFSDSIVVAGGYSVNHNKKVVILDSVEVYSPETSVWTIMPKLRFPRYHSSMTAVDGQLYICGGLIIQSRELPTPRSIPTIDRFDEDEQRWVHEADMSTSRHRATVFVIGEKLYLMGGMNSDDKQTLTTGECYNVERREWETQMNLPTPMIGIISQHQYQPTTQSSTIG